MHLTKSLIQMKVQNRQLFFCRI